MLSRGGGFIVLLSYIGMWRKAEIHLARQVPYGLIRSQCLLLEIWRGWIEFSFVQKAQCGRRLQSRVLWVITQCRSWWGTDCIAQNISNWPFCTLTHEARLSPHNKSIHFLKRCLNSFQRYLKSKWNTFRWSSRHRNTKKKIQYFQKQNVMGSAVQHRELYNFPNKLSVCVTCAMTFLGFVLKGTLLKN